MSDSALVKAREAGVDKETRQRRPTASAGSAGGGGGWGGGGGGGGGGASGSSAGGPEAKKQKKQKPAKWADVKTVAEAYEMLGLAKPSGSATKEEADLVKKVSRKMALNVHPDKVGDDAEFKELGRAMSMIRDERFRGTDWLNVSYFGAANRNQRFGAPGAKKWA
jgi:hypothetical protein